MIVPGTLNLTMTRGCTFESFTLQMTDVNGDPVDLTGFTTNAEVRVASGTTVIINLSPSITDAANGIITIPEINDETTLTYTAATYLWDLLLEETAPDNMQRILAGRFDIINKITLST